MTTPSVTQPNVAVDAWTGPSLAQLRHAIDQHAIVSMTNAAGVIIHASDRFCEVSGYTHGELIGQNHRLVKSDWHEPAFYETLWQTISTGQTWHGEVCNRRKNGELYWVEATIVPLLDASGLPCQYISIRTEITVLKQRELELKQHRQRLQLAVEGPGDGIWDWTVATGEMPLSGNYEGMLGYEKGELTPTIEAWSASVHPDDQLHVKAVLDDYLAGRRPDYTVELRLRCKDGRYKWILCRGSVAERGHEGQALRMIGIHSDISERKAVEHALVQARETAERASNAKSDFLSSMSHELRTPMNAIIGFAQLLEHDAQLNAEQRDSAHEVLKAGQHLLALINEVLNLAKVESGHIDLSVEAVTLGALVQDCLHLIAPLAAQRDIVLQAHVAEQAAVFADHTRLKQSLLNLLSNAVKYNRPAGRITVGTQLQDNGCWRLAVSDTGPGIAPERLGELFQPFQRLGAEFSEIEGTGIGLTLVHRMINMMGGEVGVESAVGEGSTFWLELRAEAADDSHDTDHSGASPEAVSPAPASRAATVLAIDDNPANLKLITQVMGMRQHVRLLTAHNPGLGIELALAHRPDLVLLDINMPGLDGYQVLDVLQTHAGQAGIPVIAITANAMPRDVERGLAAGFAAYLTKPLNIREFLQVLDGLLGPTSI